MDEQAILATLQCVVAEHYGQSECAFYSLNTRTLDDDRIVYKMYRVDLPDHSSWVISAAHDDLIEYHTFRWESQGTAMRWLEGRVSVMSTLARLGYPVPQVIPARSSEFIVKSDAWSVLVTTWIEGQNSLFQPEPLSEAGALLARLHLLPLENMPPARWNSSYSIPHAILALEKVRATIPASHYAFYQQCLACLRTIFDALPTLPESLIHGDCWMQNAVRTDTGIIFIDWETAGRGAIILDLADFLLRSQCDMNGAHPHCLKAEHIIAAVSGYASHRIPDDSELDVLTLATRFSSMWRAAWLLTQGQGWTSRLEQWLARVQATNELAEPTADLARSTFHRFR